MKEKIYHIVLSVFLFVVGILIIGNAFSFWNINVFFKGWWTLFIIIPALEALLFQNGKSASFYTLLFGVEVLLYNQGVINFNILWKTLLAFFIILIAVSVLVSIFRKDKMPKARNRSVPLYIGIFGGVDIFLPEGVNVITSGISILGGTENKVKKSTSKGKKIINVYIENFSLFGGVEIK